MSLQDGIYGVRGNLGGGGKFGKIGSYGIHVGWNNVHSEYNQYISQELGKISRIAKENNWGKRKIQKEIRMLQSEVKKD